LKTDSLLKPSSVGQWSYICFILIQQKQEEMRGFLKKYHRQLEKNCGDLKRWLREMRQTHGAIPCELLDVLPSVGYD